MKESTLHSLVIARTLLDRAEPLCTSEDRYLASAGLVVLQDAIEAVFYAILIELGIDESKSLERKSFDELIGELKAAGVPVHKSGTLKALNKQRVLGTCKSCRRPRSKIARSVCASAVSRQNTQR